MGTMQLDPRKPSISHEPSGIDKTPNSFLDIPWSHLPRLGPSDTRNDPLQETITNINGHRTRRNSLREYPPTSRATERLPTWVRDLGDGGCAVFLAGVGVFLPLGDEGCVGACIFGVEGWVEGAS